VLLRVLKRLSFDTLPKFVQKINLGDAADNKTMSSSFGNFAGQHCNRQQSTLKFLQIAPIHKYQAVTKGVVP
jgi:hypothetical protein